MSFFDTFEASGLRLRHLVGLLLEWSNRAFCGLVRGTVAGPIRLPDDLY